MFYFSASILALTINVSLFKCALSISNVVLCQTFLQQRVIRVNDLCYECEFIMVFARVRIWYVKQVKFLLL